MSNETIIPAEHGTRVVRRIGNQVVLSEHVIAWVVDYDSGATEGRWDEKAQKIVTTRVIQKPTATTIPIGLRGLIEVNQNLIGYQLPGGEVELRSGARFASIEKLQASIKEEAAACA
jgi:hypothetical protein